MGYNCDTLCCTRNNITVTCRTAIFDLLNPQLFVHSFHKVSNIKDKVKYQVTDTQIMNKERTMW